MDNFNWVSRKNPKSPVTQESLALGLRDPSELDPVFSLLDPDSPQDIPPTSTPDPADGRAASTPGSVLEPGLAVSPRAWMMSTSS